MHQSQSPSKEAPLALPLPILLSSLLQGCWSTDIHLIKIAPGCQLLEHADCIPKWFTVFPNENHTFLSFILKGHLFKKGKEKPFGKTSSELFFGVFGKYTMLESSKKNIQISTVIENTAYFALSWCKQTPPL